MTRVVVTGGSGKLGRACVRDLVQHGHQVFNVDLAAPRESQCPFIQADLCDLGQVLQVLSQVDDQYNEVDAVVHLAAIPAPGLTPNATVFERNTISTYNIFEGARRVGIKNVVWASSETVLGLPFKEDPPYIPVDEEYAPRPETAYSLSKLVGEEMARQFCRWDPELKIVCLRFSNVMEPDDYAAFRDFEADPSVRRWNLWGYIDARDGAQAVRRSLDATIRGMEIFVIANADTVMRRPNEQLVAGEFPGVPFRAMASPNDTLLSIDKARRVLGYEPQWSWRNQAAQDP
jgi:nucleoside-diphosphate-sugar epimerase